MFFKTFNSKWILNTAGFIPMAGLLFFNTGCSSVNCGPIQFVHYPNLKLGFTTQCFIECVEVNVDNAKGFIDYAQVKGFHWIELRDPDAVLTPSQCREISDYAKSKHIEVSYANQRGLLDPDFWEVYSRGIQNAKLFAGTGTIRALISGKNFQDATKKGLTASELEQTAVMANKAAALAKENGLQLVIENGSEPLKGDGRTYFGLTECFERFNADVGWQFDTGNFFVGTRPIPTNEEVLAFLNRHAGNLYYLHLKSAQHLQPQLALCDNVLDFGTIFSIVAAHEIDYLAIELVATNRKQDIYRRLDESLVYLKKSLFKRIRG